MKKTFAWTACLATLAIAIAGFTLSGCEKAKNTRGLIIIPGFADLTSGFTNFTQNFRVDPENLSDLSLPLVWRVGNPALGVISSSGGFSAAYARTGQHGDNSIFVEDQYGAQGTATVRQ
ncbi:MAG: hypothetical protein O3A51_02960 [Verrucomicrobia bacterium]|nr:hypothetical protein [Verrucomicrobiota bacterium]